MLAQGVPGILYASTDGGVWSMPTTPCPSVSCLPMSLDSFRSAPPDSWGDLLAYAQSLGYEDTGSAVSCGSQSPGGRVVLAGLENPTASAGENTLGLIYSEPAGLSWLVRKDTNGGIVLFNSDGGIYISASGVAEEATPDGQVMQMSLQDKGRLKGGIIYSDTQCDPTGLCNAKWVCTINKFLSLDGKKPLLDVVKVCGTGILACAGSIFDPIVCEEAESACLAFGIKTVVEGVALDAICAKDKYCPSIGTPCDPGKGKATEYHQGSPCLQGGCAWGVCRTDPFVGEYLAGPCDDGDPCTGPDSCDVGFCISGSPVPCLGGTPIPSPMPTAIPTPPLSVCPPYVVGSTPLFCDLTAPAAVPEICDQVLNGGTGLNLDLSFCASDAEGDISEACIAWCNRDLDATNSCAGVSDLSTLSWECRPVHLPPGPTNDCYSLTGTEAFVSSYPSPGSYYLLFRLRDAAGHELKGGNPPTIGAEFDPVTVLGNVAGANLTIRDAEQAPWVGLPGTVEVSFSPLLGLTQAEYLSTMNGSQTSLEFAREVEPGAVFYAATTLNAPYLSGPGMSGRPDVSSFIAVKDIGTANEKVWINATARFDNPLTFSESYEWQTHYFSGDPSDRQGTRFLRIGSVDRGLNFVQAKIVSDFDVQLLPRCSAQ